MYNPSKTECNDLQVSRTNILFSIEHMKKNISDIDICHHFRENPVVSIIFLILTLKAATHFKKVATE